MDSRVFNELPSPLLNTLEAASYLGIKPQTLRKWRVTGSGPKFCRLGGRRIIRYRIRDLEKFVKSAG
jgi:hypothetical protein